MSNDFSFLGITRNRFPNFLESSFKREVDEVCRNARTLLKKRKEVSMSLKKGKPGECVVLRIILLDQQASHCLSWAVGICLMNIFVRCCHLNPYLSDGVEF